MSIYHKIMIGWFEGLGDQKRAAEVREALAEASAPPQKKEEEKPQEKIDTRPLEQAKAHITDGKSSSGFRYGDGTGAAPGASAPASSSSNQQAAAASSSSSSSSSSAPESGRGGGGSGSGAEAGAGGEKGGEKGEKQDTKQDTKTDDKAHEPVSIEPLKMPLDDPLAGLYSDRMKSKIITTAGQRLSSTARDSVIAQEAALLPPQLRGLAGKVNVDWDISKEGREKRIAALNGEIPECYRGTKFDPAVIKFAEQARTAEAAKGVEKDSNSASHSVTKSPAGLEPKAAGLSPETAAIPEPKSPAVSSPAAAPKVPTMPTPKPPVRDSGDRER